MKNLQRLIKIHTELLKENPFCYFELAYTRRTNWMAWICSNMREDDPDRKVIACGQGSTPEKAAVEALTFYEKNILAK